MQEDVKENVLIFKVGSESQSILETNIPVRAPKNVSKKIHESSKV